MFAHRTNQPIILIARQIIQLPRPTCPIRGMKSEKERRRGPTYSILERWMEYGRRKREVWPASKSGEERERSNFLCPKDGEYLIFFFFIRKGERMGKRERRWVKQSSARGWKKERKSRGKGKGWRSVPRVPMVLRPTFESKRAPPFTIRPNYPSGNPFHPSLAFSRYFTTANYTYLRPRLGERPRAETRFLWILYCFSTARREEQRAPGQAFFFFVPRLVVALSSLPFAPINRFPDRYSSRSIFHNFFEKNFISS